MIHKIYHIERKDPADCDEYDSFVVIADSPEEALSLAPTQEDYFKIENVTIELIGHTNKEKKLVISSYNAG